MSGPSKWIEASRDEPIVAVAERSLRLRLAAVGQLLPLAVHCADENIEHIHQLRVWSRRATAAIRLYRDLIPWVRSGRLKEHLTRIRRAANDARDGDVLSLRLAVDQSDAGASRLLQRVRTHRVQSQQPLIEIFERLDQGARFQRLADKLLERLVKRARTDLQLTVRFGTWARENLRPYVDQFFHDGQADLHDVDSLHQFRISAKKLRYTMELLAGAFPSGFTKRLYPKVETIQERLGEINDLATALRQYQRWREEVEDSSEVAYLQAVEAAEEDRLQQRHREFLAWWTPQRSKRLAKAFDKVLTFKKKSRPGPSGALSSDK